jgi:hypothetical protein
MCWKAAFLAKLARYSAVLGLHGVLASFCGFGVVPTWASNVTTQVAGDHPGPTVKFNDFVCSRFSTLSMER